MKMKILLLTILAILFTSCGFEEFLALTGLEDVPAYSLDTSSDSTETAVSDSDSNSDSDSDSDSDDATPTYSTIVDYASIVVGSKKASAIVALTDTSESGATVIVTDPDGNSKTLTYDSGNFYYNTGGITATSGETFIVSVTIDGTTYSGAVSVT